MFPNADSDSSDIEARIVIQQWEGRFRGSPGRWSEVLEMLETSGMVQLRNPTFDEDFPELYSTSFCYVILNLIAYVIIFPIGCAACCFFKLPGGPTLVRRIGRLALILGLLLVVGMGFNLLWTEFVYGRLYDSSDYACDFFPYLPITQGTLDAKFGGQVGGLLSASSLFELQMVWFVFAASTWVVTIWCYRRVMAFVQLCQEAFLPNATAPAG